MRSLDIVSLVEVREQRQRLKGFSKPHPGKQDVSSDPSSAEHCDADASPTHSIPRPQRPKKKYQTHSSARIQLAPFSHMYAMNESPESYSCACATTTRRTVSARLLQLRHRPR